MHQVSELDASFLYLETDRAPLHVGGAFVFKKKSARSKFNFIRFRTLLGAKLNQERFFRHRIVESTLNLELPLWAEDPDFDLDYHLRYTSLSDHPGTATLNDLTAEFFSKPLNRQKPLWRVTYVDGLEQDSEYSKQHFALLIKVHIAAIDGNTGEDILSQLLKVSPEEEMLDEPEAWQPQPLPKQGNWLDEAYNNAFTIPKKIAHLARDTASSAFYSVLFDRLQRLNLPKSLMSVPLTPVNQPVSNKRAIDSMCVSAHEIRAIRQALHDVTTNDIIMGICAEALRHYLLDASPSFPKAPMIALSPISVRSTSLEVKTGNQLAANLFSLATLEKNPLKRIRKIHRAAQSSSHYDAAISASRLTELTPSCMSALSARVYSEFLLAQKHKPMFNLPITNIPGPQFPLYIEDNELTRHICASPLFDGLGLGITIISYSGEFSITTTYCPELVDTDKKFSRYLEEALARIKEYKEAEENEPKAAPNNQTGLIEDVVGLVSNLFSSTEKDEEKNSRQE